MNADDLKRLRNAANNAVERVYRRRDEIGGAVNWADLSCVEAAWVRTDRGDEHAEVLIEEAAPEAVELQRAVKAELAIDGWPDVSARTEW